MSNRKMEECTPLPCGTTTQLLRNTSFAPQEVADAAHHAAMLIADTIEVDMARGYIGNNVSTAQRSTTYLQGGRSYRRADSLRGGQTIV